MEEGICQMAWVILRTPSCTGSATWVEVEFDRILNKEPSCSAISSTSRPKFLATNGKSVPISMAALVSGGIEVESVPFSRGISSAPQLPGETYQLACPLGEPFLKPAVPAALAVWVEAGIPSMPEDLSKASVPAGELVQSRLQEEDLSLG